MKTNRLTTLLGVWVFGLSGLQTGWAEDAINANAGFFADASTTADYHALTIRELQAALSGGRYARATNYYNNTDKSKIEALYGTWRLTYKITNDQTDLLQVDSAANDSSFGYYGWDNTHAISCFYEPNLLGTPYSYQCLHIVDSKAGTAQRYLFNLNGNSLSGKYFIGTVEGFITAINSNKLIDLVGCNATAIGSCSAGTPSNSNSDSVYNSATEEVSIPRVLVFGKAYSAVLKHEGNGILRLKTLNPL